MQPSSTSKVRRTPGDHGAIRSDGSEGAHGSLDPTAAGRGL